MRKSASSRSSARSSKSRRIESQSSNLFLEREAHGLYVFVLSHDLIQKVCNFLGHASRRSCLTAPLTTALFLRTAARLAAAFPRSPSRNAARAFCFAALAFMAFLPNTGENDDRAVVNRRRPHARAACRWFEHNKITHWLFLRIIIARVAAENRILLLQRNLPHGP